MLAVDLGDLDDRDVERAAAQVVNGNLAIAALLVEAVSQGSRRRLVDDALDLEARDLARVLRGLALPPLSAFTILYGTMPTSFWTTSSLNLRPMRRLMAYSVLLGFVTACRFAVWPTSTSPSFVKATMEGVVRSPSLFSMTFGLPPSMTATHEFVVPRSMPITLAMWLLQNRKM
jgi:hypothetical protein